MKKLDHSDPGAASARRARLQALLFNRAEPGTTLRTSADDSPKIPPFVGE